MNHAQDADHFIIGKNNIIITGMVQGKLPYLIFLRDGDEAFYVCALFRQQEDGSYRCSKRNTRYLCSGSEDLRDLTVNDIEFAAISAWKTGRISTGAERAKLKS